MAKEKKVGFKLYRHYLWFAIAGAMLVLAGFLLIEMGARSPIPFWWMNFIGTFIFLILGSAIIHASIWSVFGDRGIVKRALVSFGFALLLVFGTILGFILIIRGDESTVVAQTIFLLAFPLVVAAQVPFWFLRGAFGWQLVRDGEQPVIMSLKQLFLITMIFGIAFVMPSVAGNVYVSGAAGNSLIVGSTHYTNELKEDGSYETIETKITLENRQQLLHEEIRQFKTQINQLTIFYSMALAIVSLLSIPVFWFTFRLGKGKALLYSVLYGVLLYCLAGLGYVPFFGFQYFWFQISPYFVFGIPSVLFLIIIPLAISRSKGFWLSAGRVVPAKVDQPLEPVVDPLA